MYTHNEIECKTCSSLVIGWTKDLIKLDRCYQLVCPICNTKNEFFPKCNFSSVGIQNGSVKMALS
ncbi:hypothetical protein CGI77_23465 [Vibrio parahaemolyticus]|nr:hypothetical protein CGI77_23465 [Vibrio parahaemolyticus]